MCQSMTTAGRRRFQNHCKKRNVYATASSGSAGGFWTNRQSTAGRLGSLVKRTQSRNRERLKIRQTKYRGRTLRMNLGAGTRNRSTCSLLSSWNFSSAGMIASPSYPTCRSAEPQALEKHFLEVTRCDNTAAHGKDLPERQCGQLPATRGRGIACEGTDQCPRAQSLPRAVFYLARS